MPTTKTAPQKAPQTDTSKAPGDGSSMIKKTTELSDQVLEQVQTGQRSAIAAVRKFMESVDEALPPHGENPSRRQEVIDSALEMSERLVKTQYDFLATVMHSAGEALGASGKKE